MPELKRSPSVLQLLPNGLLGFFDLKNGGDYPSTLVNTLQPCLETLDWYAGTNGEPTTTGASAPGAGINQAGLLFTVPQKEYWYVQEYTAFFTAGAGGTVVNGRAALFRFNGASNDAVDVGDPVTLAATLQDLSSLKKRYFLRPGDSLGWTISNVTVAAASVTGRAFIARLRSGV